MNCPEPGAFQAYVEGTASDEEQARLRAHLEGCDACRVLLLGLPSRVDALSPTRPDRPAAPSGVGRGQSTGVGRGQSIGRYVVVSRLGEGGMGVVYAAYDPELDRKVAVKVIRRLEDDGARATQELQARLMREAQAMARVSHAHVTAVHDVGRHGDDVFVAMELVDGETLASWLRRPRSTREIVDVFVRAGQGLAAAHSAGLVHRDFKPNNVMIDAQGRVRVMDFGLARPAESVDDGAPPPTSPLHHEITATGLLLGTPGYMAPEQLAREPADARSDQFSFCVALYEALGGARPFKADDTDELRKAIEAQALQPPKHKVPPWLLRVVERGLRPSPGERWPSMNVLLEALGRDPTRRRRRVIVAALGVALVVAGGVAMRRLAAAPVNLCRGSERKLSGVWDASRRAIIKGAFDKSGVAFGMSSFDATAAFLDRYAKGWVDARRDACEATRVRGEQSDEVLDLRMTCLDDRLGELASLTEVLASADATVVEHAPKAAQSLAPLDGCADVKGLRARVPPPRDAATRDKAEALRKQLHDVRAQYAAGKDEQALTLAAPLVQGVAALGYMPLEADARLAHGDALLRLGHVPEAAAELEAAALDAERGHDDATALEAWCRLAILQATAAPQPEEALRTLKLAEAELDRVGATDARRMKVRHAAGVVLQAAGQFDAARAAAEEAVAIGKRIDSPELAGSMWELANLYDQQERAADALALNQDALARMRKAFGPDHPYVQSLELNLGINLMMMDRAEAALAAIDTALATARRIQPVDGQAAAMSLAARARVLMELERPRESLTDAERALAIFDGIPGHPPFVDALIDVGLARLTLGHAAEAKAPLEQALATLAEQHAPPMASVEPRFLLGRALWETGQHARGRALAVAADRDAGHDNPVTQDLRDWLKQHR